MMTKTNAAAKDRWIVETYKNLSCSKRRVFKTREEAIDYINDAQDRLECDGKDSRNYDWQIIHNTDIEQTGINGNNR